MHQTEKYRRHSTYESAKPVLSALFAAKMLPNSQRATGLIVWISPILSFPAQASSLSNEATLDEKRTHTSGGQV
jgi:hypothetical protein